MEDKDLSIVYTTLNDLSSYGGIETEITNEINFLQSKNFDLYVLSPSPLDTIRIKESEKVHFVHFPRNILRIWWPLRYSLVIAWLYIELFKIGRMRRIVSVSFTVVDGAAPSLLKLIGLKIKVILRIVGPLSYEVEHFAPTKQMKYIIAGRLSRLIEAFSYLVADIILPVSEFEEDNVNRYLVDKKKIKLSRCGIDSEIFSGKARTTPIELPNGFKVVLFVGRFVEKNGPLVIADAVPAVLLDMPKTIFVFVGDGPLRPVIESKLSTEIRAKRVILTGFRKDISEIHAQADIYAGHLSSKVEGLGQTVFEALMSGLPVVTGRDKISEYLLTDGFDSILIPKDSPEALSEKIIMLLRDERLASEIGNRARETAIKKLSFNRMMDLLIEEFPK